MDAKKVNQIKRQLKRRGYERYTVNLVSNDDFAYIKTIRDADGEVKHIISHGFYDWRAEDGVTEDYEYTPKVVLRAAGAMRVEVTFTHPKFSVHECEEIAEKLTEFFKPYFEKYKVRKI